MRIVVKNLPMSTTKDELESYFSKLFEATDVYMLETAVGKFRRVCFVGYRTEEEAVKAQEYYNNAMFKNHKIKVEINKENRNDRSPTEIQKRKISYSKSIIITGFSRISTSNNKNVGDNSKYIAFLEEEMKKVGEIEKIKIESENNKLFATITFKDGRDAVKAYRTVKEIGGVRVNVRMRREEKDDKKKYYNMLFFDFKSVIKRICERERIDKRDLLNLNETALGSRVAVLEATLVDETKQYLVNNGVYLDNLLDERSETELILRNDDVLGVLELVRGEYKVSLSPSQTLAILRFENREDALACYKENNMRRYKNGVIYCEFLPLSSNEGAVESSGKGAVERSGKGAVESNENGNKTTKLIVKNVPFQATEKDLRKIFEKLESVVDVRLPLKNEKMHRGFGFVVLNSADGVKKALEYFGSSTHLYGRRLVLEVAKK